MESKFKKGIRNLFNRKLIQKDEQKITAVQLLGLGLILLGVVVTLIFIFSGGGQCGIEPTAEKVALTFLVISLGIAFAFPDLLQDHSGGLSTMRVVVFMMTNVLCMLFIKFGWTADSFSAMGIDGYWVSIVAFVFGAKAAQSYFENMKGAPAPQTPVSTLSNTTVTEDMVRLAIAQNKTALMAKHANIQSLSDTLKNGGHVVAIYIHDRNTENLPRELDVVLPDGAHAKVPTEIVSGLGNSRPQIGQATDNITDSRSQDYPGSVCCLVTSDDMPGFTGAVTSGHIFTRGGFQDYNGLVPDSQVRSAAIGGNNMGDFYFQYMKPDQDLAIVRITDKSSLFNNYVYLEKGYYNVSNADIGTPTPNVTIMSKDGKVRDAYILDYNVEMNFPYAGYINPMKNLIFLGDTPDKNDCKTVSKGGDSGSCVYHKQTRKMIGMLLGGNDRMTYVLPIEKTLDDFNFKPITK